MLEWCKLTLNERCDHVEIDAKTQSLCLLGHPVAHSFSPKIHNHMSESLKLNYVYTAHDVEPVNLKAAVEGLKALGYRGANVTVPHKSAVIEHLDEISEEAAIIGAVNTILSEGGRLKGFNTDCYGFERMLQDEGVHLSRKHVLILGAGGAARAVVAACILGGAERIGVCSRQIDSARAYVDVFKGGSDPNIAWEAITYEDLDPGKALDYDLVVNCTPLGMHPNEGVAPIDPSIFSKDTVLVDLIYNPELTEFLRIGRERGMKVVGGLGMLIHQALKAYEIWTGRSKDADFVKMALKK